LFPNDPLMDDCVRITVGRPEDNDRLLGAVMSEESTNGD
jgi:histidinol-phosphate/aromatic aminotransferase/cobyric acid decarboxylase-like protein